MLRTSVRDRVQLTTLFSELISTTPKSITSITLGTPAEVEKKMEKLHSEETPGIDRISARILEGVSKNAMLMLVYIFEAFLQL